MSAVEEVEVVTSGFGAQYGNAQSGVVNITMKEGKTDKWRTRLEARMRAPGLKYFGPSLYDEQAQPYLLKLSDPEFWKSGDASTGNRPILGIFSQGHSFTHDQHQAEEGRDEKSHAHHEFEQGKSFFIFLCFHLPHFLTLRYIPKIKMAYSPREIPQVKIGRKTFNWKINYSSKSVISVLIFIDSLLTIQRKSVLSLTSHFIFLKVVKGGN